MGKIPAPADVSCVVFMIDRTTDEPATAFPCLRLVLLIGDRRSSADGAVRVALVIALGLWKWRFEPFLCAQSG